MDNYQSSYSLLFLCFFFCCFSFTTSVNFSFPSFLPTDENITVEGGAMRDRVFDYDSIQLTDYVGLGPTSNERNAAGRAYFYQPIQLWDPSTNITTDFTTVFDFVQQPNKADSGSGSGGIAFFIASEDSSKIIPKNSSEGWLGLFNGTTDGNSSNQMVAVEFDTYQDQWDPSDNHVGINVNSIVSEVNVTWSHTLVSGDTLRARVSYNGTSEELNVYVQLAEIFHVVQGSLNLTYRVDMRILPPNVFVGFSASTGQATTTQLIRSWNFTSTLDVPVEKNGGGDQNSKLWLIALVAVAVVFVICWQRKRRRKKQKEEEDEDEDEEMGILDSMDEDFIRGTGPKRFAYKELVVATKNFSEEGKLGQGGFGGVYKGLLEKLNMEIAVKKISSNSNQGKKEYISEVKIISRLRHRNLVQLIGWSHQKGIFLLVYEYMHNGSLDSHLFGKKSHLSWPLRDKIVHGLASGLLYLHEEWEQCVVHRDIKSSNLMLDSNFNAKLGDFGLARLVDHGKLGSQTTVVAGTVGYMASEYLISGKASKESDVFSFGVVALEIACGRKVVEPRAEESKISLVNWVWELYGNGRLLEAVDETLNGEYDREGMKCLMSVGLWCAHPDHTLRPSIREAIQVLKFEASLPSLPSKMPVPMYYAPTAMTSNLLFTSSSEDTTKTTRIATRPTPSTSSSQEENGVM